MRLVVFVALDTAAFAGHRHHKSASFEEEEPKALVVPEVDADWGFDGDPGSDYLPELDQDPESSYLPELLQGSGGSGATWDEDEEDGSGSGSGSGETVSRR